MEPLSAKRLARPHSLDRLRRLVVDPRMAVIVPFVVTDLEVQLALALGVPIYGADPKLAAFGSKAGARALFREEEIPHAQGVDDLRDPSDQVDAIRKLRDRNPALRGAIVKLNNGFGGNGNALIDLAEVEERGIEAVISGLTMEDASATPDEFLAALWRGGGIIEDRVAGDEYRSPSVQLRASPTGEVEVLSTHDQILGGPNGLTFRGSSFPADPDYARDITRDALKLGQRLAREGAIGRFAVDFVAVRDRGGPWRSDAIEINLRCGGTTATYFALQALTDAAYDPASAQLVSDGKPKYYVASDHLAGDEYRTLTPDDLLDLVDAGELDWDAGRRTGVAFHMISSIAVAGFVGATAIGDTRDEALAIYNRTRQVLEATSAERR